MNFTITERPLFLFWITLGSIHQLSILAYPAQACKRLKPIPADVPGLLKVHANQGCLCSGPEGGGHTPEAVR